MYTRILLPLDGSKTAECVLPSVRYLASALTIPVELLAVLETVGMGTSMEVQKAPSLGMFADEARRASQSYLERISQTFSQGAVTSSVQTGIPADVILAKAAAAGPSMLIAMATHGRSGLDRWLLGSVAEKVLRHAHNPLLLIRAADEGKAADGTLKSVIVPLDGSGLAEKILPHVSYLAKQLNLAVHLTRVYNLPPDAYLVGDGLMVSGPALYRERVHAEAQTYLEGKEQELRGDGLKEVVVTAIEGDPAGEIIDLARTAANGLVAMSTHGRSGIGRWALGSVAEKVIRHGKNPVLVIRPE
jgi:nucleotide-binding universal stress UspA family protein